MKKFLLAAFMLVVTGNLTAISQVLETGASIPMADVKMKSVDGKEVSIKDQMKKNGVLVMFSCNTCPYVVKYQKRTQDILRRLIKIILE
jgi:thioredoxin-related protein